MYKLYRFCFRENFLLVLCQELDLIKATCGGQNLIAYVLINGIDLGLAFG